MKVLCTVLNERKKSKELDSDSPTLVIAFLYVTSRVATLALVTQILGISFYFSSNEWHILLEILAILSMILENLIAINTQTSIKRIIRIRP